MRLNKIFYSIISTALLMVIFSCTSGNEEEAYLLPEFDKLLTEYIHWDYSKNSDDDSIYQVVFFSTKGKQYFVLTNTGMHYNKEHLDGCFEKEGKLITYYAINKSWRDSLISIPKDKQCIDSLKRYVDFKTFFADSNRIYCRPLFIQYYEIISKNKYRKIKNPDSIINDEKLKAAIGQATEGIYVERVKSTIKFTSPK